MAWTPELRAKYAASSAEKVRLGLKAPPDAHRREKVMRQRLQERLHPALRHVTLEAMFQSAPREPEIVTRRNAMKYVRLLSDGSVKLDTMAKLWDSMGDHRQKQTSLEQLCEKVELGVPEFIGLIAPRAYQMGHTLAKLFVGLAQPELAQVSIAAARNKKDGFKDRQMILQSGGIAPSPKGIQIAVNQTNVTQSELPDFDSQTIDLADTVRGE